MNICAKCKYSDHNGAWNYLARCKKFAYDVDYVTGYRERAHCREVNIDGTCNSYVEASWLHKLIVKAKIF